MSKEGIDQYYVTTVIPTLNSANCIRRAVNSALGQLDDKAHQIIIVDGGSTDQTKEIVESLQKVHLNIKFIRDKRGGPGLARLKAIEESSSKFIAFLDADDWWLPGKLHSQIELMERDGLSLTYTDYQLFYEEREILGREIKSPKTTSLTEFILRRGICNSTAVFVRSALDVDRYKSAVPDYAEDFLMWCLILEKSMQRAANTGLVQGVYSISKQNRSTHYLQNLRGVMQSLTRGLNHSKVEAFLFITIFVSLVSVRKLRNKFGV